MASGSSGVNGSIFTSLTTVSLRYRARNSASGIGSPPFTRTWAPVTESMNASPRLAFGLSLIQVFRPAASVGMPSTTCQSSPLSLPALERDRACPWR